MGVNTMKNLIRKYDSIVMHGAVTQINEHVLIIPHSDVKDSPTPLPKEFFPLDYKGLQGAISIAVTFESGVVKFSRGKEPDNLIAHGESEDYTIDAWFNYSLQGSMPNEVNHKVCLRIDYLRRIAKMSSKEVREFSWGFLLHPTAESTHIPVFRFNTFYWYQMPCMDDLINT